MCNFFIDMNHCDKKNAGARIGGSFCHDRCSGDRTDMFSIKKSCQLEHQIQVPTGGQVVPIGVVALDLSCIVAMQT